MGISTFVQIRELHLSGDGSVWREESSHDVHLYGSENGNYHVLLDFLKDVNGFEWLTRTLNEYEKPGVVMTVSMREFDEDWYCCPPEVLLEWDGWDRPCTMKWSNVSPEEQPTNRHTGFDVIAHCESLLTYQKHNPLKRYLLCWRWSN